MLIYSGLAAHIQPTNDKGGGEENGHPATHQMTPLMDDSIRNPTKY